MTLPTTFSEEAATMFLWQLTTSWHKELRIPSPVCFDLKGIEFDHDDYEIRKHSHLHRRHRRHQAAAPADPAATEDDTSLKSKHESDQVKREEDAPYPESRPTSRLGHHQAPPLQ